MIIEILIKVICLFGQSEKQWAQHVLYIPRQGEHIHKGDEVFKVVWVDHFVTRDASVPTIVLKVQKVDK